MTHIIHETHLSATEQDWGGVLSVRMGGLCCPLPIVDWLWSWEVVECDIICENYVEKLGK